MRLATNSFVDGSSFLRQPSVRNLGLIYAVGAVLLVAVIVIGVLDLLQQFTLPEIPAGKDEIVASSRPDVERRVMQLLSAGQQSSAEQVLQQQIASFPAAVKFSQLLASGNNLEAEQYLQTHVGELRGAQRTYFLFAACTRTRFEVEEAYPVFNVVRAINPNTPSGKCALCMMRLDSRQHLFSQQQSVDQALAELKRLVTAHPSDVMLQWMMAVQCRTWNRNAEGAQLYKRILSRWETGPVLVHQTYANLLDELGRHNEALVERYKAVKLEPASWSYHGLGSTLRQLGRDKDSQEAFEMAKKLSE